MPLTLTIPRRFAPSYSLLGRWLRRRVGDRLQAEAYYLLALAGLTVLSVLLSYGAWAVWHPVLLAVPTGPTAIAFGTAHVLALGLFVATALVGSRPAIHVGAGAVGVHVRQGDDTVRLRYADLVGVERISALRYHRHERHYAAVWPFINHPERDVLLLRSAAGFTVALGLSDADHAALREIIDRRRVPSSVEA